MAGGAAGQRDVAFMDLELAGASSEQSAIAQGSQHSLEGKSLEPGLSFGFMPSASLNNAGCDDPPVLHGVGAGVGLDSPVRVIRRQIERHLAAGLADLSDSLGASVGVTGDERGVADTVRVIPEQGPRGGIVLLGDVGVERADDRPSAAGLPARRGGRGGGDGAGRDLNGPVAFGVDREVVVATRVRRVDRGSGRAADAERIGDRLVVRAEALLVAAQQVGDEVAVAALT